MTGPGDNRLCVLAAEIRTAHAQAVAAVRTSLQHAIAAGERLLEAKQLVGHGRWLAWLSANVGFSERTAQSYMRVAKRRSEIKSAAAADFTLRAALEAVAVRQEQDHDGGDVRLLPLYGHARVGVAVKKSVWIVPSEHHPGFLYVTVILDTDTNAQAVGIKRPVRMSALDIVVDAIAENDAIEWHDIQAEPWMHGPLLEEVSP